MGLRVFDRWTTWPQAEAGLGSLVPAEDLAVLREAYQFAKACHGDQVRPTGDPYERHLLEAVEVLATGAGVLDRDVLVAALLHDVVEDTACTLEEVRDRFGPEVAELVDWVTKTDPPPGGDREAARLAYLRRLAGAPRKAVLVKLADRLSNVQRLDRLPRPEKRRAYYRETVDWILPLAAGVPFFHEQFARWASRFAELG
ncbi:MAG TPA: HD domain-containing protein [Actinomycetes bacterium]|nr:HD domain-containing protein [Actinomycetes bacterium]